MRTTLAVLLLVLAATPVFAAGTSGSPLAGLLDSYEAVRVALATDDRAAAKTAAELLANVAGDSTFEADALAPRLSRIAAAARRLAGTSDIEAAREEFESISRDMVAIALADPTLQEGMTLIACPMVDGYGEWIQKSGATANPYWGSQMLTCGTQKAWN